MSSKEVEIFNAIDAGTFKYAQQLCSKLIKKNPKLTYYHVLNTYILFKSGKEKEAVKEAIQEMSKTPNDVNSLAVLNKLFNEAGMKKEAIQIYENAAKKYPSFELLTTWFHLGCEQANARILQKSSTALKNFNDRRLFRFWAAFTSCLVASLPDATSIEKALFPKLGLKTIESCKPFQNEQEVYVYVKLLQLNNLLSQIPQEIIEFSKNDKLDLELQILLLTVLDELEDYENLYKWSLVVLQDYKLDDFRSWKYLVKSAIRLEIDVSSILENYQTRNSYLAIIEYKIQSKSDIQEALFKYFERFGYKGCAFSDIKEYISHVNTDEFLKWLEEHSDGKVRNEKDLIWTVNLVKLRALVDKSLIGSESFIVENIKNFKNSQHLLAKKPNSDYFYGDEFILFVVQSLLSQKVSTENILVSIVILENLVPKDEHEFHLRTWLIQLYSLINCHTRARYHYEALKIKNIQHDIFDHFLLSRLSSIYPNSGEIEKTSKIYQANDTETVYFLKVGFNKGAFNKLGGMIELFQRLDNSFMKKHKILEGVQIGRLLNDKHIYEKYSKLSLASETSDNRDFRILWSTGIDEELPFSTELLANIPKDGYNEVIEFQERLIGGDDIDVPENLNLDSLSAVEKWAFDLILNLSKFINRGDSDAQSRAKQLFHIIPEIPCDLTWNISHTIITELKLGKALGRMIIDSNSLSTKPKKADISEIRALNQQMLGNLRDELILIKRNDVKSSVDGYKARLVNNEILKLLEINSATINKILDIVSFSNMETFNLLRLL